MMATISEECRECGSEDGVRLCIKDNGLRFCKDCGTCVSDVSYGNVYSFATITERDRFTPFSGQQVIRVKQIKNKTNRNCIENWTTTDAFDKIIEFQSKQFCEIIDKDNKYFDKKPELLKTYSDIWLKYKRELVNTSDKNGDIKLHRSSKKRDKCLLNPNCDRMPRNRGSICVLAEQIDISAIINANKRNNKALNETDKRNTKKQKVCDKSGKQSSVTNEVSSDSDSETNHQIMNNTLETDYERTENVLNVNYDNDIALMTLPKTLAILNLLLRLNNINAFTSDLIRWVNELSLSYLNCLSILPEDWVKLHCDYRAFMNIESPSAKNININTASIAHCFIGLSGNHSYEDCKPSFEHLIERYLNDLNLPKAFKPYILKTFDFYKDFRKQLKFNETSKSIPQFDRWALISIIMVLKRWFGFDDKFERTHKISKQERNEGTNVFVINEWLDYTKTRIKRIERYTSLPYMPRKASHVRDLDVITQYYSNYFDERNKHQIISTRNHNTHDVENRAQLSRTILELLDIDSQHNLKTNPIQLPKSSFYPLSDSTQFALKTCSSSRSEELSKDFRECQVNVKQCVKYYKSLNITNDKPFESMRFEKSFRLLIKLCCSLLFCHKKDVYYIFKSMDNVLNRDIDKYKRGLIDV